MTLAAAQFEPRLANEKTMTPTGASAVAGVFFWIIALASPLPLKRDVTDGLQFDLKVPSPALFTIEMVLNLSLGARGRHVQHDFVLTR